MHPAIPAGRLTVATNSDVFPEPGSRPVVIEAAESPAISPSIPKKKRKGLRRLAAFVMLIAIFTGVLYGTHAYMSRAGLWPEIRNPFKTQTAVANTDVFLRAEPNLDNDRTVLLTKNSKVKIVNSQNNWYQVDIIEQGHVSANQSSVTRGWLKGKYLDLD
jgi:uncharacterized protein YgiM (DUF1202 family)